MLATIYCGFIDVSNIVAILFWSLWGIISVMYVFLNPLYERNYLLKFAVFVSLIIAIFSLYGLLIQHGQLIDNLILQSHFSKQVKTLMFNFFAVFLALFVAFLFAPIAVNIGGKHLVIFCLSSAFFPLIINEYLYALFMVFGTFTSFYGYKRFLYARP